MGISSSNPVEDDLQRRSNRIRQTIRSSQTKTDQIENISKVTKHLKIEIDIFEGNRTDWRYKEFHTFLTTYAREVQTIKHASKKQQYFDRCEEVLGEIQNCLQRLETRVSFNEQDKNSFVMSVESDPSTIRNFNLGLPSPSLLNQKCAEELQPSSKKRNKHKVQDFKPLENLEQQTQKLENEIKLSILRGDTNQLVVHEKKIILLYTDLQLITVDEYTPMNGKKAAIAKQLVKFNNQIKHFKKILEKEVNEQPINEQELGAELFKPAIQKESEDQVDDVTKMEYHLDDLAIQALTFDGVQGDETYKELEQILESYWMTLYYLMYAVGDEDRKRNSLIVARIKNILQGLSKRAEGNERQLRAIQTIHEIDCQFRSLWAKLSEVKEQNEHVKRSKAKVINDIQYALNDLSDGKITNAEGPKGVLPMSGLISNESIRTEASNVVPEVENFSTRRWTEDPAPTPPDQAKNVNRETGSDRNQQIVNENQTITGEEKKVVDYQNLDPERATESVLWVESQQEQFSGIPIASSLKQDRSSVNITSQDGKQQLQHPQPDSPVSTLPDVVQLQKVQNQSQRRDADSPHHKLNSLREKLAELLIKIEQFPGKLTDEEYLQIENELVGYFEELEGVDKNVTISKEQYANSTAETLKYLQEKDHPSKAYQLQSSKKIDEKSAEKHVEYPEGRGLWKQKEPKPPILKLPKSKSSDSISDKPRSYYEVSDSTSGYLVSHNSFSNVHSNRASDFQFPRKINPPIEKRTDRNDQRALDTKPGISFPNHEEIRTIDGKMEQKEWLRKINPPIERHTDRNYQRALDTKPGISFQNHEEIRTIDGKMEQKEWLRKINPPIEKHTDRNYQRALDTKPGISFPNHEEIRTIDGKMEHKEWLRKINPPIEKHTKTNAHFLLHSADNPERYCSHELENREEGNCKEKAKTEVRKI